MMMKKKGGEEEKISGDSFESYQGLWMAGLGLISGLMDLFGLKGVRAKLGS